MIETLLGDLALRKRMGEAKRARVRPDWIQVFGPKVVAIFAGL